MWIYFTYYLYTSTLSMFCLKVLVCLRVIHIYIYIYIYIYTCICFFISTGYVHNTWILYICSCAPAGLRQTAAFHWSYQFMSWASLCWWPLMALCDALFQWRYLLLGLRTTHLFDVCAGLSKHGRLAQKWRHDACLFPMSIGKMNLEWCFKPLQSKCTRSTLWTNPIRRSLNGWGEDSEERDLATWSPPIRIEQPELTL